ncbi:hypothetical protein JOE51_006315 [Bradyrhizobium japonicum]|nr:hypothetical protein [Bradyrhizobium japonicum]
MSQPPPYAPSHYFVSNAATLANFPGQALDIEFNGIKTTTDAIEANLKLIQRDDGALANQSVSADQLTDDLRLLVGDLTITSQVNASRDAAVASAAAAASSQTAAAGSATSASTSATNAAASATAAQGFVAGLAGSSVSSVAIATGSKSFTAQTGKQWAAGQFVTLSSNANSANYMHGSITSYNSGTGALVVNVLDIGGSGTFADWNIAISGSQGPIGQTGPSGAVGVSGTPSAGQIPSWTSATTLKGTTINGLVKGNGASDPTAAAAGADYVAPGTATAFTKQQSFTLATITDQATLSWDVSSAQKAKVTLGGNRTMGAVTNAVEGTTYSLWVIQDATGSRTISWTTTGAGSFDFGAGGAPTLTTTLNKADLLTFEAIAIGGTLKLRFSGIMRGFS